MKVAALLVFALLVGAALAAPSLKDRQTASKERWEAWKTKYGKQYNDDAEDAKRFGVYRMNLRRISMMNKVDAGAQYAENEFADLTAEEFANTHHNLKGLQRPADAKVAADLPLDDIPTSFDWRDHTPAVVAPVKNQGQCGSCWAFSTVANLETIWALAGHDLTEFSEQYLVDCDKECDVNGTCDQGCNGGLMSNAMTYVTKNGEEEEKDYPYAGVDQDCKAKEHKIAMNIGGWEWLSKNEDQIAAYVVNHGVVSIGLNAEWMQFYFGGVSDPMWCNPDKIDHGVAIVGYGVEGKKPYWIIRNSWGGSWGEKGYYRLIRGKGKCGVNLFVTSAHV